MSSNGLNIAVKQLSHILSVYGIKDEIINTDTIWNAVETRNSIIRIKTIIRIQTSVGAYIVKVVKEEEHPINIIEQQCKFSEVLRMNGIDTPKRYSNSQGAFATVFTFENYECVVTLEDSIGTKELQYINERNVKEVARLLAKIHKISIQERCTIEINTIWDLFDENSDINGGFKRFRQLVREYRELFSDEMILLVEKKYSSLKESLSKKWSRLPQCAVQGDVSTNNFIVDDCGNIIGIIDYNISGKEILVNDMITEGLFYTYIMDLNPTRTTLTRKEYFNIFVQEYLDERELAPPRKN